jgi:hypothetical protein
VKVSVGSTSRALIRLVLPQQGEDEPEQLTGGQDKRTAVLETDRFAVLAQVEGAEVRGSEADAVSGQDEIVTQVAVAGLGHAAGFALELAGLHARPPQAGETGEGGLALVSGAGLPVGVGQETLNVLDFGEQTGGLDRADAGVGEQVMVAG